MHGYNDVWNYDDDGHVNGYEHVGKYMTIVIDHEYDAWYLEFDVE